MDKIMNVKYGGLDVLNPYLVKTAIPTSEVEIVTSFPKHPRLFLVNEKVRPRIMFDIKSIKPVGKLESQNHFIKDLEQSF